MFQFMYFVAALSIRAVVALSLGILIFNLTGCDGGDDGDEEGTDECLEYCYWAEGAVYRSDPEMVGYYEDACEGAPPVLAFSQECDAFVADALDETPADNICLCADPALWGVGTSWSCERWWGTAGTPEEVQEECYGPDGRGAEYRAEWLELMENT